MSGGRSSVRWTVCAFLFAATTVNYIDRQVLGVLAPTLQRELHWTEADYGQIVSWFSLVYACGFLAAGRWLDRIGVRKGLAIAVVAWSAAAIATAFAQTTLAFKAARAALGLAESANFPGAIKATAEWFPQRERALATGIFNAGSNTGAIVTPLLVVWIVPRWGWRWAFIATGSLGLLWLVAWLRWYRRPEAHPRLTPGELALIRSDTAPSAPDPISLPRLLQLRQTWAVVAAKLFADPIWWFYLYWLPKFLDTRYGIKLAQVAVPIIIVYVVADAGSVAGGWLSSALIRHGWSVNRARKTTMLAAALLIVPTAFAAGAPTWWAAVAIVSVAAAAHQAWSANVYTLASDMFPRSTVASVIGIGGFVSGLGAFAFQRLTGDVLQGNGGNYTPIFAVCGSAYVTAWCIVHLLAPRMEVVAAPG